MAKIDGSLVTLFIEQNSAWVTLAYATELELDVTAEIISKAATGNGGWVARKKRRLGWNVTAKHLMSDVAQRVEIESLIASQQPVTILLAMVPTGGFNYGSVSPAEAIVSGAVHLTRMSITAQQGSMSVLNLQMAGNGALSEANL